MEWHPTKNENLKPSDVTCGSNQKVWWYLPYDDPITGKHFDFEWESKIGNRTILNRNCPYLTGQAVWVGFNDLATLRPDLAKEWHLTKNGDLKPKDVTVSSNQKVWWRIQYTDPENRVLILEWETTVAHRALEGTKHPYMNAPKSERFIYNFLLDNNIDFQFEYTINVVHNNRKRLSFDFYLPNDRLIIEYDGEQHFVNRRHFGTYSFEKVVNRDSIKNKYCKDNGIPILRIPYIFDPTKQESEIKDMILQFLQDRQVPDAILDFYANQKDHNYYDVAMKLNAMNKAT